jgi:hypothetical protein
MQRHNSHATNKILRTRLKPLNEEHLIIQLFLHRPKVILLENIASTVVKVPPAIKHTSKII